MAKIILNIEFDTDKEVLANVLANLVRDPILVAATGGVAAPVAPAITELEVLQFLVADPRYTMRTLKALEKHFGHEAVAEVIVKLDDAIAARLVTTKRRRRDGVTLYHITSGGVAAVDSYVQAETAESVLAFLRKQERYTQRTLDAIVKNVDAATSDIEYVLDELVDDGDVKRLRRRADGVALYQAI